MTARVPTRTNRDDRYFTDAYQAMPLHGYTRMFERMLDHPNIKVMLNTDYREIEGSVALRRSRSAPVRSTSTSTTASASCRTARCSSSGKRSNTAQAQPVAVMNYPNDNLYTRVTEFKHLTGQEHPKTTRVYEYPQAEGDPYYPDPAPGKRRALQAYQELAAVTPACISSGGWAPTSTTTWIRSWRRR